MKYSRRRHGRHATCPRTKPRLVVPRHPVCRRCSGGLLCTTICVASFRTFCCDSLLVPRTHHASLSNLRSVPLSLFSSGYLSFSTLLCFHPSRSISLFFIVSLFLIFRFLYVSLCYSLAFRSALCVVILVSLPPCCSLFLSKRLSVAFLSTLYSSLFSVLPLPSPLHPFHVYFLRPSQSHGQISILLRARARSPFFVLAPGKKRQGWGRSGREDPRELHSVRFRSTSIYFFAPLFFPVFCILTPSPSRNRDV